MTNPNTPTPSNSVVTEAMIEAGCLEVDDWGETERRGPDFVKAIYLAMQSANTIGSDELVWRVADAIEAVGDRMTVSQVRAGETMSRLRARATINAMQGATPDTDRVAVLTEALSVVKQQFESDFLLDGKIVDDPPTSFVAAYREANAALSKTNRENGNG